MAIHLRQAGSNFIISYNGSYSGHRMTKAIRRGRKIRGRRNVRRDKKQEGPIMNPANATDYHYLKIDEEINCVIFSAMEHRQFLDVTLASCFPPNTSFPFPLLFSLSSHVHAYLSVCVSLSHTHTIFILPSHTFFFSLFIFRVV